MEQNILSDKSMQISCTYTLQLCSVLNPEATPAASLIRYGIICGVFDPCALREDRFSYILPWSVASKKVLKSPAG